MKRVERFWFKDVPPHVYALLRIAFGGLGLIEVLGPWPLSMFWPLDGIVPLPGGGLGIRAALLDHGLGNAAGCALVLVLASSFAAMCAGAMSGAAVSAAFLGSLVQIHWNPLPLSSAHQVLVVMLFCLLWADTGDVWSVDAWRRDRRAARAREHEQRGARRGLYAVGWDVQPIWPLRLMQCQVAIIYASSGLWKLFGPVWRDGSGVYYALSNNIFHRAPLAIPADAATLMAVFTYGTLLFELAFPILMLTRPTRRLAFIAGIMLHVGLWVTLELGLFSWLMIASYLAFLDPRRVFRFATQIGTRKPTADLAYR